MKPIRRRSDALRNDELILDAALELLRQKVLTGCPLLTFRVQQG